MAEIVQCVHVTTISLAIVATKDKIVHLIAFREWYYKPLCSVSDSLQHSIHLLLICISLSHEYLKQHAPTNAALCAFLTHVLFWFESLFRSTAVKYRMDASAVLVCYVNFALHITESPALLPLT